MRDRLAAIVATFYGRMRRGHIDDDVRSELQQHLELLTERYLRRGLSPDEAHRAARRQLGNTLRVREQIYESQRMRWVDDLRRDLRHTFRVLGRARSFAAISILSLAIGLGLTITMFAVGYGVFARPLPYPDAHRLVRIWESHRGAVVAGGAPWLSNLTYHAWNERRRTVGPIAHFGDVVVTLDGDPPIRVSGANVAPWLFDVLRVSPQVGRWFRKDDARAAATVVLGDVLWRDRFNRDPRVIGRTIRIDQRPHTVIGVAGEGFAFPYRDTQLWLPSEVTQGTTAGGGPAIAGFRAIARLVDGMTAEQASSEGTTAARRQPRVAASALWGYGGPVDVHVRPLADDMAAGIRPVVATFLAGVACLLLIACANLTTLLRLRVVAREREFTVRGAIGAGRGRIVRQLLTESVVTASIGAALAIVIAAAGVHFVRIFAPRDFPRLDAVQLDLPVVAFGWAVALTIGVLAGLSVALRAVRLDAASSLREGLATSPDRRVNTLSSIVVAAQAAVAVVLVAAAVLLGRNLLRLLSVDPGYDARNVLAAEMYIPATPGASPLTQHSRSQAFRSQLIQRVRALPGVTSAGVSNMAPLGTVTVVKPVTVSLPGRNPVTARALSYVVTPGYAEALRLRLRRGRLLTDADARPATQSMLVNDAFVRTFLSSVPPVGVALDGVLAPGVWAEIVGVVADVRKGGPGESAEPEFYVVPTSPLRHDRDRPLLYEIPRRFSLVVRTTGNPAGLIPALRAVVRDLRRDVALDDVTTLVARTTDAVRTERFAAAIIACLSAVALMLAAVGLYTVLSYRVSTRVREIGLRMALGAPPGSIARLVVWDGLRVTLAGVVVGVAGSMAMSQASRAMLVGIDTYDPLAVAVAPVLLAAVALLATWPPARRARRLDPLAALRSE